MRDRVTEFFRRRRRSEVRRMMRGFRAMRSTPDGLELVTAVKERLSRTPFTSRQASYSVLQFGAAHPHAEWAVRQFLMLHLAGVSFHKRMLLTAGTPGARLVHPLPAPWRAAVEHAGVPVSHWRSRLFWWVYIAGAFGYGLMKMCTSLWAAVKPGTPPRVSMAGTAFFDSLSPHALPAPGPDGRSFDIITWYAGQPGAAGLAGFTHTVARTAPAVAGKPVSSVSSPVPLPSRAGAGRLALWAIAAALAAAADLARGRWWHAVMWSQAGLAARARVVSRDLAAEYLFHNSGWLFRPLWTYEAERQGARILFYFYSSNVETFKYPDRYPLQANTWHVTNWPRYLVWDAQQAEFIRRHVTAPAIVDVVGPIWFHSSPEPMPPVPPSAVAVFDVQPARDSAYRILAAAKVYYTPETVTAFLDDVRTELARARRPMVFKRKRRTSGSFIHGRYRNALRRIAEDPNSVTIDPDVAGWRVVESSSAVISMPFTSTALLGRAQGKPSIFYVPDYAPYYPVQRDDRAAHGIPIVVGPVELREWLRTVAVAAESA